MTCGIAGKINNMANSLPKPANQNTKKNKPKAANQNTKQSTPKAANQNAPSGGSGSGGGSKLPKTIKPPYNKRALIAAAATLITSAGLFNFDKVKNFLTGGKDKNPSKDIIDKFFKGQPRRVKKRFIEELDELNKTRSGDSRTARPKKSEVKKPKEPEVKKLKEPEVKESKQPAFKKPPTTGLGSVGDPEAVEFRKNYKSTKTTKSKPKAVKKDKPASKTKPKKDLKPLEQGIREYDTPFGKLVVDSTDEGMRKEFGKGGMYKAPKKVYGARNGGFTRRFRG